MSDNDSILKLSDEELLKKDIDILKSMEYRTVSFLKDGTIKQTTVLLSIFQIDMLSVKNDICDLEKEFEDMIIIFDDKLWSEVGLNYSHIIKLLNKKRTQLKLLQKC